ncbi:MAG: NTP transferase domain-containing protein, partial [Rhodobacterales bacterium]|nr:NTP transferase domain-containing protein [Rhodobacterales bacterium]
MKNPPKNKSIATIILAAGQGTRMKSNVTKVLHQLGGKFLLQHVIDAALPLTESISVVVGHNSESVKNVINNN